MTKTNIKSNINLIYDSKLKYNATGRKIRRKTRNLTQSRARNDPINHQIQDFSFRDFQNKFRHSRGDFFLFSPPILDFKHSFDAETSLDEVKNKIF